MIITVNRESVWIIAEQVREAQEAGRLNPDARHTAEKLKRILAHNAANPIDIDLSQEDVNNILQSVGESAPVLVGAGERRPPPGRYYESRYEEEDPGTRAVRRTIEMAKDRPHFD